MNESNLYSSFMTFPAHLVGWLVLLLIPAILVLGYRNKASLFTILLVAWAVRVGYAAYNTYVHTAYVDDFELNASIDADAGWEYVMDGFGPSAKLYTWFCSIVYLVVGRSPLVLQGINIFFALLTISNAYEIAEVIFDRRTAIVTAGVLALFPASVMFGTLILRESIWIYPATLGALLWVRGIQFSRVGLIALALVPMLVAYAFHPGALGLIVAWCATPFINILAAGKQGIKQLLIGFGAVMLVLCTLAALVNTSFLFAMNDKIDVRAITADDIGFALESAARNRAAYLTDMTISGPLDIVRQLPIRLVFFLGMPFFWYVTSILDVGGAIDGLFYLGGLYVILRRSKELIKRPAAMALLLACVAAWAVFAVGTSNYGTAIRHRCKLLPIFCVLTIGAYRTRSKRRSDSWESMERPTVEMHRGHKERLKPSRDKSPA